MPKFGDGVVYVQGDAKFLALVIGSRSLEHHLGEDDEPMLHLVFVQKQKDAFGKDIEPTVGGIGEMNLVRVEHDVPHFSHEFSDEQKEAIQKSGVTFDAVYPGGKIPGGRWMFPGEERYLDRPKQQMAANAIEPKDEPAKKEELAVVDEPKTDSVQ
jgi:hypothetical protein